MRIVDIGFMNLDHIVSRGETESADSMHIFLGGKGINQSVALAKAGMEVYHASMIGEDGQPFLEVCKEYGIHADCIQTIGGKTGHAIIQIDHKWKEGKLLAAPIQRR